MTTAAAPAPAALGPEDPFTFLTALRAGDFSRRLPADLPGRPGEIARHLNAFARDMETMLAEITRLATEMTQGRFGGQLAVSLPPGPWRTCAESINVLEHTLTDQIRDLANTAAALADGRPHRPVTVPCQGEIAALKSSLNRLADRLRAETP